MKEKLKELLRATANRLDSIEGEDYNWKAIGACNCGQLVQTATGLNAKAISSAGIQKHGDWQSIAHLYDPTSKMQIDIIISQMIDLGMNIEDFTDLENLSNQKVLDFIGENTLLKRDERKDCIIYMRAWADLLESEEVMTEVWIEHEVES